MEISRTGPHREIERGHRLEIVVEHVRPCCDHEFKRSVLAQEIRGEDLDGRLRTTPADGANGIGETLRAPSARSSRSTEVTTICARPNLAVASATRAGSSGSSATGSPVLTLQNVQARVQVSPMIMKVACSLSQHSPMLGQPASSHTVCRPLSRMIFCVAK